jgi:hypothetical protein
VPAFLAGFLGDAAVLLVVMALAWLAARGPRAAQVAVVVVGLLLAVYAVLNVYLVAAYGSPLTATMLAYRKDADPTALFAREPLLATGLALAVVVVGAVPFARAWRRASRRAVALLLAALAGVGLVSPWLDHDGDIRALGLDRNAVALLVTSSLPRAHDARRDARTPWDAPWKAPADPAYTAPVVVDTSRGRPKNVVIWLAESTGARHTSLFGGPPNATPRLSSLKDHALLFESYDANAPISAKAIFTTLCGLYPLPDSAFESRANPRIACPSLMETLTARGYDAALFHGGYFAFTDKLSLLEERGFDELIDGESMPDREKWFTNGWGIDDAAIVERGLKWLDAREDKSRPTLSVFIPLLPHYEYFMPPGAPAPFGDEDLLARYRNGVAYSDALFGKLVDEYAARGLLDDTLFVYLGDHGEAFEEHPRNKLHAGFLYEENVHAPLVMVSTKLFSREQRSRRLGSHVDLEPTILSLLGVPPPAGLQGRSLVDEDMPYRPTILGTFYPDDMLGLRDGDWKYIENLRTGVEELYDLKKDPGEKRNVAAFFPDVTAAYRARLADYEEKQRAFILNHPKKGEGFLDRVFATLEASIVDEGGKETVCSRAKDRVVCPGGVVLTLQQERVFNMERRCLRVSPPERGRLRVKVSTTPAVRTVGVGLTDRSRFAKGTPLLARFEVEGHDAVELEVNDVFETTSRVRTLEGPPGSSSKVTVEVWSERAKNRAACLSLGP